MSARDRCPRPAEILPPTLLFNAVHQAAPPTDRLASLMLACGVYAALGAAVLGGARHLATRGPISTLPPVVIFDPEPPTVLPSVKVDPPPSGGPVPAGFRAVQPPLDTNTLPDYTPASLPTTNRSGEIAGDPNAPVGPRVVGLPPGPAPTPQAAPRAAQVVELETQAIRVLHQVPPVYPALARLVRVQGPVELRMTIDTSGAPTDIQVISGPHPLLVNEAVRVARLWRFQPALLDGTPVAATFRLTVAFRLER
ncbi:energy transducer TonB [Geothrix sp. 21YS21S-2]|uniref:energy transducer TonB n=1 Tax=Geothrix sp. 21YS21S-2 TaxID=3068893 RepID=UPI0027BA15EF|nr:energy transducer TonB [Geothrix sp. 21YS21S-2]